VSALAAFDGATSPRWRAARCGPSIHPGQDYAGRAIGLTFEQRMLYLIFPQALRRLKPIEYESKPPLGCNSATGR